MRRCRPPLNLLGKEVHEDVARQRHRDQHQQPAHEKAIERQFEDVKTGVEAKDGVAEAKGRGVAKGEKGHPASACLQGHHQGDEGRHHAQDDNGHV